MSPSGFEPEFAGPKPAVLSRLDYRPMGARAGRLFNKFMVVNFINGSRFSASVVYYEC